MSKDQPGGYVRLERLLEMLCGPAPVTPLESRRREREKEIFEWAAVRDGLPREAYLPELSWERRRIDEAISQADDARFLRSVGIGAT